MSAPLFPAPWMYGRRKLTRVEIAVYALIVALLLLVFASQAVDYLELAEKSAMETTATNVTAALNLRYASALMAGTTVDVAQWLAANPFELARAFPPGYRGELAPAAPLPAERPVWMFDPARREVLYLPRLHGHLNVAGAPADAVRFAVRRAASGFVLAPIGRYEWHLSPDR